MDPSFFPFMDIGITLDFSSLRSQLQSSVIGCRLLLTLVPRLPLVVEAGQYRPVLQKNMSSVASIGTYGRLHWQGWPPQLVRMAASIGTEV
jgi:hypothetical protein